MVEIELSPVPPYDFGKVLDYLRTSPAAVLEDVSEPDTYARAIELGGRAALIRLESAGIAEHPSLRLRVVTGTVGGSRGVEDGVVAGAVAWARRTFSLDEDPEPFWELCERDAVLGRVARRFGGLRPVLIADPYEALIWAILGQQVNVAFARKLKLALVELCGRRLELDGRCWLLMPRPEDVAVLDPDELRPRQFSRQKTEYVLGVSRAIASRELDLEGLRAMPYEEAVSELTSYKGVGRWTAEYVLMRGLGYRNVIPAADLGLRAVIGREYGLGRTATESEVRELAERWAGYRGWASFYWWMLLQAEAAGRRGG